MNKPKFIVIIIGIVILTISTLTFIRLNNDHKECSNETTFLKNNITFKSTTANSGLQKWRVSGLI